MVLSSRMSEMPASFFSLTNPAIFSSSPPFCVLYGSSSLHVRARAQHDGAAAGRVEVARALEAEDLAARREVGRGQQAEELVVRQLGVSEHRLDGQRRSRKGGFAGGWLEQLRQWLGARWPGPCPWECRATQSRQACSEEAREPSWGPAEGPL
eukprot:scaffold8620_cov62-Phaeocystis_antarctica.AAC.1